jgi:hypothetical protein
VARIVSPETRLWTSPSSKLTRAAISRVQRLVSLPNSLGEWWSISLRASALFSSTKAARVRFGREEPGCRAPSPRSLKIGVDGVSGRLGPSSEAPGYRGRGLRARTRQKYLASAQYEGIFGAQPRFQGLALLFGEFANKDWRFHEDHYSSSHTTYPVHALGFVVPAEKHKSVFCKE